MTPTINDLFIAFIRLGLTVFGGPAMWRISENFPLSAINGLIKMILKTGNRFQGYKQMDKQVEILNRQPAREPMFMMSPDFRYAFPRCEQYAGHVNYLTTVSIFPCNHLPSYNAKRPPK